VTGEPGELPLNGEWWQVAAVHDHNAAVRLHAENVTAWNEAAGEYRAQLDDTLTFLRAGRSNLHPIERANLERLGPLRDWCHQAVHLQCASGKDTISLLTEGAGHVAGVDISPVHIENARRLSAELGLDAEWYLCDVLETPHQLDGRFDLVYTGRGALSWLHDLRAWGAVVARLLRPGGVLHVLDNHPFLWFWDDQSTDLRILAGVTYFDWAADTRGWTSDYLPGLVGSVKHERGHTFTDVVGAVLDAGLELTHLAEHREDYGCDFFPRMRPEDRARIPATFSMMARRPAAQGGPG
jgi:SAM-dependent methyltransferase